MKENTIMKKLISILAVILVFIFLVGCNSNSATTTSNSTGVSKTGTTAPTATSTSSTQSIVAIPTATPQSGGTLKNTCVEPTSLGYPPTMAGVSDGQISSVALETLFNFDEKLNVVPLLASEWKSDGTAKTITISLRKGIKFQDGSDFNGSVCKWNLDQFRAGTRPELKKVTSVDLVDDYTVKLNLSSFDNTIITNLAGDPGRMISQKSFEANGGKDWATKNPVGTGPFQLVNWTKDVAVKWKRFDGYWGGKPYLDGIDMMRYGDATVALMDFKAGNLHVYSPEPKDAKALEATGQFISVLPTQGPNPALAGFAIDQNSPFAKIEVRQALSYAIDAKSIADNMGYGYWLVQNQFSVPGTWAYNSQVVGYPYNPAKAKQLLAAAGYANGLKTTLNFFNMSQIYVDEMTVIQNYLQAVGIEATLNPLQRPAFSDMASNGKGWSGIVRVQQITSPDPLVQYSGVVGGTNFAGIYLPAEFVNVYNQAVATPDIDGKQKLTQQLMALATDKYCMVNYLYVQRSPVLKSKSLHDDMMGIIPNGYISPKTWLAR
jgi:peptide/nickel transport system substrate-binding protein